MKTGLKENERNVNKVVLQLMMDYMIIIDHQSFLPLVTDDQKDFFIFDKSENSISRNIFFSRFVFIYKL